MNADFLFAPSRPPYICEHLRHLRTILPLVIFLCASTVGAQEIRRALPVERGPVEIRRALPGLSEAAAEDLLLTIVTLCHSWVSSPNINLVVTGTPDEARRRASIMRTSELLARDAANLGISENSARVRR